jgi:hypothetical protein
VARRCVAKTKQSIGRAQIQHDCIATVSGTFNSLSKVLCTFPSWYLFSIGLEFVFSFKWNVPPAWRSHPREHDSEIATRTRRCASGGRGHHPPAHPVSREYVSASSLGTYLDTTSQCLSTASQCELLPIRSPLLRESSLVVIPPLTYMLKFSGYPHLSSGPCALL